MLSTTLSTLISKVLNYFSSKFNASTVKNKIMFIIIYLCILKNKKFHYKSQQQIIVHRLKRLYK